MNVLRNIKLNINHNKKGICTLYKTGKNVLQEHETIDGSVVYNTINKM